MKPYSYWKFVQNKVIPAKHFWQIISKLWYFQSQNQRSQYSIYSQYHWLSRNKPRLISFIHLNTNHPTFILKWKMWTSKTTLSYIWTSQNRKRNENLAEQPVELDLITFFSRSIPNRIKLPSTWHKGTPIMASLLPLVPQNMILLKYHHSFTSDIVALPIDIVSVSSFLFFYGVRFVFHPPIHQRSTSM